MHVCVCVPVHAFSPVLTGSRLVWRVDRVAEWCRRGCRTDSVRMDVGDVRQGYHCHLSDHEVPRPAIKVTFTPVFLRRFREVLLFHEVLNHGKIHILIGVTVG